jgi:hypothetical protein
MTWRIRLIHWNAAEAEERAVPLLSAGYNVAYEPFSAATIRELRQNPPDVVVIDLTRLPSQGRDIGLLLRKYKTTRYVPLVFVEGDPEKVARIKELLPDAIYAEWGRVRSALQRALAHPPKDVVVPESSFAAYAGAPLAKKLGIKANSVVALVNAPQDFERTLGELPEGVMLRRQARGRCDLILWFPPCRADLERRIERMRMMVGKGGLWVAWPKKTSGIATDLSQIVVRRIGLASGWVDYKVCAIDETWTGLRFARRDAPK